MKSKNLKGLIFSLALIGVIGFGGINTYAYRNVLVPAEGSNKPSVGDEDKNKPTLNEEDKKEEKKDEKKTFLEEEKEEKKDEKKTFLEEEKEEKKDEKKTFLEEEKEEKKDEKKTFLEEDKEGKKEEKPTVDDKKEEEKETMTVDDDDKEKDKKTTFIREDEDMKEMKRKMDEVNKKWNALTDAQKNEIYTLNEQQIDLKIKALDKCKEFGLIDNDIATKMKEHLNEMKTNLRKSGKLPMMKWGKSHKGMKPKLNK